MVDSVVGIKPWAVQLKVRFGSNYVLEKKGLSQFLYISPALQRLTCAWKQDWNLRIHFPKEIIKPMDTLSSASTLRHQETTHAQSSGSIQKASVHLQCCVPSKKLPLTHSHSALYCSWHGLAQGTDLLFHKDPYTGPTDETFTPSLRITWQLLPRTVVEKSLSPN